MKFKRPSRSINCEGPFLACGFRVNVWFDHVDVNPEISGKFLILAVGLTIVPGSEFT